MSYAPASDPFQPLPLVSIVVPCLNRADFLRPTIDSILEQRYPAIECIVVDGGSTDGTLDILKSYGSRVAWVSEPDAGHADAINKGWRMSRGSILAWLNADDLYAGPDAASKAVEYLQAHPEVDLVYGDYRRVDPRGRLLPGKIRPRRWDLAYAVAHCDYLIPQATTFIRRGVLERVGWLDTAFIQKKDHELWLRVGLAGTIHYLPDLLAYVRDTPGISQRGAEVGRSCVQLTRKFFSLPDLPPSFTREPFRRRAFSNAYLAGSQYALMNGVHPRLTSAYLWRAVTVDPSNLPGILLTLARSLYVSLVPSPARRRVRGIYTGPP